jgi:hypothetical protein
LERTTGFEPATAALDAQSQPRPGIVAEGLIYETPVQAVGVAGLVTFDMGPVPSAFVAATLNRYVVPFVRGVTVWVGAVELNDCGASA